VELTLVRRADIDEISCAALQGDAVAAGLWRAVESFEGGCFGKSCLFCERPFRIQCSPAAFWVSDKIAVGLCESCSAQPDRRLRRRVQKFEVQR
jgi:hypothetical protein